MKKFPSINRASAVHLLAIVLLLTYSCSTDKKGSRESKDGESLGGGMTAVGDSVEIPPFKIEVKLSSRAEKKLSQDHETIVVDAYFEGIPTDTTRQEFQDEGSVPVGGHKIELNAPGIANFAGVRIARAEFESLADKNFEVLINIYTGRRSSELNLLNCDILQEPISKVRGKKFVLKGDLID